MGEKIRKNEKGAGAAGIEEGMVWRWIRWIAEIAR
jgi:hypothetical protein